MKGPFSRCLSILIYHRVVAEPDALQPDVVSRAEFEWQMAALDRWFRPLPLREAVRRLREGTLPVRAACVTFDDGYADNAAVALPVLKKQGIPATFFVATSFLNGGRMFNDSVIEAVRRAGGSTLDAGTAGLPALPIATVEDRRRAIARLLATFKYLPVDERERRVDALCGTVGRALPGDLMMTSGQVRELREAGMEIGAHTVTHPILAKVDAVRARAEMAASRSALEEITGAPVTLFAYPNGRPGHDYGPEHVRMVRDLGFESAVSTAPGISHGDSDLYQLPRFTPWDRTPGRFVLRLLHNTLRTNAERA